MEQTPIVRCGGKVVTYPSRREEPVQSLETTRKGVVDTMARVLTTTFVSSALYMKNTTITVLADNGANELREGFMEILDVFTAIAEPILWFYALIGCIMMATGKNRDLGWKRIKQVGYAYLSIALLPTFFSFLRWLANILEGAMQL